MFIILTNYICSPCNCHMSSWITVPVQQCTVLPICHPTTHLEHTSCTPWLFECSIEAPCFYYTLAIHDFFFQSFASDTLFLSLLLHSLRVNLDMGKIVYSWVIRRDSKIPGTVVRSSTIPEQLGRISYLLTDKTGICVENPALSRGMLLLLFGFWSVLLNPKLKISIKTAFRVSFYSRMTVA